MKLLMPDVDSGLALAQRVDPKYAPVWAGRAEAERAALAWYFLPHRSGKPVLAPTRPRAVKWYCPFADQRTFPSGHRYCVNVYSGCSHGCVYCYAAGYLHMDARPKTDFRRLLLKDLDDLDAFDVPPAPVHLSNSTDAFQPLEDHRGDTLFALRQILARRRRFTTVTVVTKNPALAARPEYLDVLTELARTGRLVVEVSLAFWRQDAAAAYDPGAPPPAERIEAIRRLRRAGLPAVLRLAPLYPITGDGRRPRPQRPDDVEHLVRLAADLGLERIVYTPAKIVRPKHGPLHPLMRAMLASCRKLAAPRRLEFRGGSWRLPAEAAARHTVGPLLARCREHNVRAECCKAHLLANR